MISFTSRGSFDKTEAWLRSMKSNRLREILEKHGQEGVRALASATPKESGVAATSWGYEVRVTGKSASIAWTNSNDENGFPVAIMLQYGYGTGTGGYVAGRDYINPAIRPIFDKISAEAWKAVTNG